MQIYGVSQQMIVGQLIILELLSRLSVGCLYKASPGPAVVRHFAKNIRPYILAPHDTQTLHIKKIFPTTMMIDIPKGTATRSRLQQLRSTDSQTVGLRYRSGHLFEPYKEGLWVVVCSGCVRAV